MVGLVLLSKNNFVYERVTYHTVFVDSIQTHGGATIQCDEAPIQRLERVVLQEWVVFGNIAEIDWKVHICEF